MNEDFIDIEQAAEILKLKTDSMYHLIKRKGIPCYKPGGKLLFLKSELIEWVKNGVKKKL